MSLRNVTIDTSANPTQFTYVPPSCAGAAGWALKSTNASEVSYRSCTLQGKESMSVNLTFTGVGVYYQSPFFDGLSLRFILDGTPSTDVNLSSPVGLGTSSAPAVGTFWQKQGLENRTHVLEITPGAGVKTLNIGSFIITESLPANVTSAATPKAAAQAGPTQSETTTRVGIGFGATFGALAFFIFLWIAFTLAQRRHTQQEKQYEWPDEEVAHDDRAEVDFDRSAFSPNSQSHVHAAPGTYASRVSLSTDGQQPAPTASDHGIASPVPSNTLLLSQRAPSSQGHNDAGPSTTYVAYSSRLEPVRPLPQPSQAPSPSLTSVNRYANPHAYSPQHKPIPLLSRTPVVRSTTMPAPYASDVHLSSDASPSVERSTTFSGKLEPLRKQRT